MSTDKLCPWPLRSETREQLHAINERTQDADGLLTSKPSTRPERPNCRDSCHLTESQCSRLFSERAAAYPFALQSKKGATQTARRTSCIAETHCALRSSGLCKSRNGCLTCRAVFSCDLMTTHSGLASTRLLLLCIVVYVKRLNRKQYGLQICRGLT